MTTSDLIRLLESVEYGGIHTSTAREISLRTPSGEYFPCVDIAVCSSGDGCAGPELGLVIVSNGRID